ncbi:MAG: glycoside hydrolase family 65 protein [Gammaproteobacteria bacterium]|nr:glycoside hydrolase family 65 protein [Gammaproteobacteria bacterium]
MNQYLKIDPWKIIEEGFNPDNNRSSESLFSIGNGYMGQRASFEEKYSGDMLQGNYIAGVYFPDPTKVGWWKNGYPEYYARIANNTNWIGIDVAIDNETLDLATCKVNDFTRVLNMQEGYLERSFTATLASGKKLKIESLRFISLVDKEIGAIKYSVTPLNFSNSLMTITPYLDSDVKNESTNYGDTFVATVAEKTEKNAAFITTKTTKHDIHVCTGMSFSITPATSKIEAIKQDKHVAHQITLPTQTDQTVTIYKYAANVTSHDYELEQLLPKCKELSKNAMSKGFDTMLNEQRTAWAEKWQQNDVIIEGDEAMQQGIRFSIFQLAQTFSGKDQRLNVNPKGFTGEKYGATIQWDSESICVPYYLSTAPEAVTKNLLLYRYNHLDKAIKNAAALGYINGAALFPMATVNGDECQNEWEITFEEIHRNGAMAHAIFNYVRYTDDKNYLVDYGLEVLIAIARYWAQRVHFSPAKNQYVIHGVTGPNEYENNINNNWHTNNIACWTMKYAIEVIDYVKQASPEKYSTLSKKLNFKETEESEKWQDIISNMYFPIDKTTGVFLQQEDYLDKEQIMAKDLDPAVRPINQYWSWDRILRSCFIKQADVLQGIYFFMDQFDHETIKKNFDFYEPRTVHESSLSPSTHAILAARLGYTDKTYELLLRSIRLDLDDYNSEVSEGCHITSMAGSWLVIAHGLAGMWVKNGKLTFAPFMLPNWKSYSFKTSFRGCLLNVKITRDSVIIDNESDKAINVVVNDIEHTIDANQMINIRK